LDLPATSTGWLAARRIVGIGGSAGASGSSSSADRRSRRGGVDPGDNCGGIGVGGVQIVDDA